MGKIELYQILRDKYYNKIILPAKLKTIKSMLAISNEEENCEKQIFDNSVVFILPSFFKFSGGHSTLLKLGTKLAQNGFKVFYFCYDSSVRSNYKKARKIYESFEGLFIDEKSLLTTTFSFGVATDFLSIYFLKKYIKHFSKLVYFVQDYEPFFFPKGDYYYLAKETYNKKINIITLGSWVKNQIILQNQKETIKSITFPFDDKLFPITQRKFFIKDEIKLAVYIKIDDRRLPHLLLSQLSYLYHEFKTDIKVTINIFGLSKSFKMDFANNLGKLNPQKMRELFIYSDIGVVGSATNISLVNFEMIASGLPVIDYEFGSAKHFFNTDEMIFITTELNDLATKINYCLTHEDVLQQKIKAAQKQISKNTWANTSSQFINILNAL